MTAGLNVILPAAGKGTRLGLPYPKELHRIEQGKSLIDFSLDHIRLYSHLVDQISVTVVEGKEIVADYVQDSFPDIPVKKLYFNPNYTEWPGSILSAQEQFCERNIVFLPDSIVSPIPGQSLLKKYVSHFVDNEEVIFGYKRVSCSDPIQNLGALKIEGQTLQRFCDKPGSENSCDFNAFWTTFGFRKDAGEDLLKMMMQSVARDEVDICALGRDVGVFEVNDYLDLGTWPAIDLYSAMRSDAS